MNYKYQIFVHVDSEGNVTDYYGGYNSVATDDFHYFFLTDDIKVLQQADKYRVIIENYIPKLILKDGFELE